MGQLKGPRIPLWRHCRALCVRANRAWHRARYEEVYQHAPFCRRWRCDAGMNPMGTCRSVSLVKPVTYTETPFNVVATRSRINGKQYIDLTLTGIPLTGATEEIRASNASRIAGQLVQVGARMVGGRR